jgi:hypothetical protein
MDAKASCNAANRSKALVGMLPDSVAVKKGWDLRESAATPIAICKPNSRLSSARQYESR